MTFISHSVATHLKLSKDFYSFALGKLSILHCETMYCENLSMLEAKATFIEIFDLADLLGAIFLIMNV